jgi:hypothetical protein
VHRTPWNDARVALSDARFGWTSAVVVTDAPTPLDDASIARVHALFQRTDAVVQPMCVDVYVVVNVIADADADVKREDVVVPPKRFTDCRLPSPDPADGQSGTRETPPSRPSDPARPA